jgi:amphiphysin
MQSFADNSKYDVATAPGPQIQHDYESKRTDAWEHIETLSIIKRIVSVCECDLIFVILELTNLGLVLIARLVQAQRSQGGPGAAGVSRANTVASTASSSYASGKGPAPAPPPSRAVSGAGYKKAPPPPPGASSYAPPPPPYTASTPGAGGSQLQMPEPSLARAPSASSTLAATKRPPPPPPVKPKPKPAATYVTALYDFDAQVFPSDRQSNSRH